MPDIYAGWGVPRGRCRPEQIVAGTPETTYFAIVPTRMAALMEEVGFTNVGRIDGCLFQPVLVGTR